MPKMIPICEAAHKFVLCFFLTLFCSAFGVFAQSNQEMVSLTVGNGNFDVTVPKDKCFYKEFSKLESDPAIVFFGACSRAKPSGMFTLSIGTADKRQNAMQLKAFFQSTTGKAALAQSKTSEGVSIEEIRQKNGILYLRLTDKSGPLVPLTEKTVWRAMFQLSDHFFSIAYLPLASKEIGPDAAFDQLREFALKFKRQNIRWIPAGLQKNTK